MIVIFLLEGYGVLDLTVVQYPQIGLIYTLLQSGTHLLNSSNNNILTEAA